MNHEKYATINVLTTFNYVCQDEGHLIFCSVYSHHFLSVFFLILFLMVEVWHKLLKNMNVFRQKESDI